MHNCKDMPLLIRIIIRHTVLHVWIMSEYVNPGLLSQDLLWWSWGLCPCLFFCYRACQQLASGGGTSTCTHTEKRDLPENDRRAAGYHWHVCRQIRQQQWHFSKDCKKPLSKSIPPFMHTPFYLAAGTMNIKHSWKKLHQFLRKGDLDHWRKFVHAK